MERLDDRSRMSGDVHVRFCEPEGEVPLGYSTGDIRQVRTSGSTSAGECKPILRGKAQSEGEQS